RGEGRAQPPDSVGINDEGQGDRAVQCDHGAAADPQVGEPTGNAFDVAAQLLVAGFRALGDIDDRNLVTVCLAQPAEGEIVDPNGIAFEMAAQLLVAGFRAIGDIDDRNLVLVCRVQLAEGEFVDPNVGDLDGLPRALNWHGWSFLGAIG